MKRLVEHLAPLLGSGALTFLLYGYSLSLSFMLDDFDDLPRDQAAAAYPDNAVPVGRVHLPGAGR